MGVPAPGGDQHHGRGERGGRQCSEEIDPAAPLGQGKAEPGRDGEEGDDADGHVDVEDPAPGQSVGERSAEHRAGHERHGGDRAQEGLESHSLTRRCEVTGDGHHQRCDASAANALEGAGERQHGEALRQPAEQGSHEEDDDRELKDPLASVHVPELAENQGGDRTGEEVRNRDPGTAAGVRPQVTGDARQCRHHDRLVEIGHEERQHQRDHQHDDGLRIPSSVRGICTRYFLESAREDAPGPGASSWS